MREHPSASGLRRRRADAGHDASHVLDEEVPDPRGGTAPVRTLLVRRDGVHDRIRADQDRGSRRHDRISRGQRRLGTVLPVLDGLVLFWFLAGVLNADLRRLDVTTVVAAVLAVLASVAVAAWNDHVGRHLQTFTDDERRVVWGGLDATAVVMVVATVTMWLALGLMMALRVSEEIYQATGELGVGGWVVAVALAAALVLVNAYVLMLALSDGSVLTRELDALGKALRGPLHRLERHRRREATLGHRIVARAEAVDRIHPDATAPRLLDRG